VPRSAVYPAATGRVPALGLQFGFVLPRLIPQRQLHPIPQPQLVIDHAQIIFHHVFGGADGVSHVAIFQTLGDKLDDSVLPFTRDAVSIAFICEHNNCLR
jgi:hypothetical protein